MLFPGAGRMLRGDGKGVFEDITVGANLLDIQDVDYSILDPQDSPFDAKRQRIGAEFHENGKGLAKGDLNNDGYVDLMLSTALGYGGCLPRCVALLDDRRTVAVDGTIRPVRVWLGPLRCQVCDSLVPIPASRLEVYTAFSSRDHE